MKHYSITLEVDEGWLDAIQKFTDVDILDGELMFWKNVEEI
jgi:hypothetical protein